MQALREGLKIGVHLDDVAHVEKLVSERAGMAGVVDVLDEMSPRAANFTV